MYNGYTNYETWVVNLWLDNDIGTYHYTRELATECSNIGQLSMEIQGFVEDSSPIGEASVYLDLLTSALQNVNWTEIAENIWEEIKPE